MCCCGLNASEKHSEREEKGGEVEGWMAPELFSSVCPSGHCFTLGLVGLEEREGENKPDFYPGTGNKRFSESVLTLLS